jgi:hypothetical protein
MGGTVKGSELNVYVQRRDLNRGWSTTSRQYRKLETYCGENASTLCWNRPIYSDQSALPLQIEIGAVKANDEVWVELFDNFYADGEFAKLLTTRRQKNIARIRRLTSR